MKSNSKHIVTPTDINPKDFRENAFLELVNRVYLSGVSTLNTPDTNSDYKPNSISINTLENNKKLYVDLKVKAYNSNREVLVNIWVQKKAENSKNTSLFENKLLDLKNSFIELRELSKSNNEVRKYRRKLTSIIDSLDGKNIPISKISSTDFLNNTIIEILSPKNFRRNIITISLIYKLMIQLDRVSDLRKYLEKHLNRLLIDDCDYFRSKHIHSLQKILASNYSTTSFYSIYNRCAYILKERCINSNKHDIFFSLLLTTAEKEKEFNILTSNIDSFISRAPHIDISKLPYFLETLRRSPAKMYFLSKFNSFQHQLLSTSPTKPAHTEGLYLFHYLYNENNGEYGQSSPSFHLFLEKFNDLESSRKKDLFFDIRRVKTRNRNLAFSLLDVVLSLFTNHTFNHETLVSNALILHTCAPYMAPLDLITIYNNRSDDSFKWTLLSLLGLKVIFLSELRKLYIDENIYHQIDMSNINQIHSFFDGNISLWSKNYKKLSPTNKVSSKNLISVIITTFNPDIPLITDSIKSICIQTYQNIEIVLIDDASEFDISLKLENLVEYCKKAYPINIHLHKNKTNRGQYYSRNIAINIAKGNYICIQDDDDISHPERLRKQLNVFLIDPYIRACFCKHIRFSDDVYPSIDDKVTLSVFGDGPATFMCNKSIFKEIGGFKHVRSRGDIEFRSRLEEHYGKNTIHFIQVPLYFMRSSLSTVSSTYEYFYNDRLTHFRDVINNYSKYTFFKGENCE